MKISALSCPNCGGPFNPQKRNCQYCGSFLIFTDLKEENYSIDMFSNVERTDNYKGIYIYGILLDRDEYPVRMGVANYKKSALNAVGGHLLLTNKRLAFISHGINIGGKMALDLPTSSLYKAEAGMNLGISAQYSVYDLKQGKYTFVIYGQKEWIVRTNGVINGNYPPIIQNIVDSEKTMNSNKENSYIKELVELKKLLDEGIITQEDYDLKKRILLRI